MRTLRIALYFLWCLLLGTLHLPLPLTVALFALFTYVLIWRD